MLFSFSVYLIHLLLLLFACFMLLCPLHLFCLMYYLLLSTCVFSNCIPLFFPVFDVFLSLRYVHSVGRTARMGRHGTAATLYNKNSSERLAIKRLLAALGARDKQQQKQKQQVLRRRIDSANLEAIDKEVRRASATES